MTDVDVLDREMYSEAEAARILNLSQSTLHYWLEGGERRKKLYQPVIRERARGSRRVTWAEFIEAGLLREYRKVHGVPMDALRRFIVQLRHDFDVPYPLAHYRPYVSGRGLIYEAQESIGLDADYCLVAFASNQLILTPAADSFVKRVDWADDIAVGWRPHADPASEVRMIPDVRFGQPAVGGISTEILWEQYEADETEDELVRTFGLTPAQVRWALAYEGARQPAA